MSLNNNVGRALTLSVAGVFALSVAGVVAAMLHLGAFDSHPETPASTQSGPGVDARSRDVPDAPGHMPETVTEADGELPAGATVFDDYPTIANLDPGLRRALRAAAADARRDGVVFHIASGWRSQEYQERLLQEYVAAYGSEAEAARWVAPADKSLHVSGDAKARGCPDICADATHDPRLQ